MSQHIIKKGDKVVIYPVIDMPKTGENIKCLCEGKNITVKELQEYMGFACPQTIYRWFCGLALPNVDNLLALSILLGITMNEILVERNYEEVEQSIKNRDDITDILYRRVIKYMFSLCRDCGDAGQ